MPQLAKYLIAAFFALFFANGAHGDDSTVSLGDDGVLEYQSDEWGNRVPDFSHCGYRGANQSLPQVSDEVFVRPSGEDDTKQIQSAIDFVAQLPINEADLRGAVLLGRGEFRVSGQLKIRMSGVVLRGQGAGDGGTIIRATGHDRRSLIRVMATSRAGGNRPAKRSFLVLDDYVPVGTTRIRIDSTEGLSVGTRVEITQPSSKEWIDNLGMSLLGWRQGTRDIRWRRTITAIDGFRIILDAPLTLALDKKYQATVQRVNDSLRLREIGIEDLTLVSDFDKRNPKDEEHSWYGIHMQCVQDGWVSRVRFRHFAGGAVMLGDQTSRITVEDCASFAPMSELAGYRRHTFFTLGQQCLFLRCWSESGLHDFSVGHSAGPNAFVHCYAKNALGDSGPRESCASGVLFDNVHIEGNDLNLMNRWNSPPKVGWSAMNCLLWQCQAANVRCDDPPMSDNWAIGVWATPHGDGHFENLSEFVKPISIYQQQLRERVGDKIAEHVGPFMLNTVSATNPNVEQASKFTTRSAKPARQLIDVIRARWKIDRTANRRIPRIEDVAEPKPKLNGPKTDHRLEIKNGWLIANGKLMTGDHYRPMWWRGDLQPERAKEMGPAVTRFAPGRNGTGLTDDLDEVAEHLANKNVVGYDHHYGLWYDRRRDDHLMVRRDNGEAAPPFYEQPFARSGTGQAWDGLSRYDLTKFNSWYWDRLREFAALGERRGFVLFHHNYFQHNVLEAGAHWSDSPWRPANNVNVTALPEPPVYVGNKRVFLAEKFYDVSNPHLHELHRKYIRQCLKNFCDRRNVIQLTSGEFTGPLSFMQFWIDTIVAWEKETGSEVIVALSCTKDVQDAILNDPVRSRHVDIVDVRYWTYTSDGEIYAPAGGKNLSPRQHLRQLKPASTSFESIIRSIREYIQRYPEKAVTYNAHIHCRAKRDGWAILMGGGSLPNVPRLPDELASAIAQMTPHDRSKLAGGQWCLANGEQDFLVYSDLKERSEFLLPFDKHYEWATVNAVTGQLNSFSTAVGGSISIGSDRTILWIRRLDKDESELR